MTHRSNREVIYLDSYETPLGDKVIERHRVDELGNVWANFVLIGPDARLSLAPDWQREQGRVWR